MVAVRACVIWDFEDAESASLAGKAKAEFTLARSVLWGADAKGNPGKPRALARVFESSNLR